jgi:hypothetical protein
MQAFLGPVLEKRTSETVPFPLEGRPRLAPQGKNETSAR